MKKLAIAILLFSTNVAISQNLGCLMIDFEEIDNDSLFEGKVISDQFSAQFGLTFELEGGGSPVLAQVGNPLTAFSGFGGAGDTPDPADAAEIGDYFLTDDGNWLDTAVPIILNFTTPIDSFAGCILDMDGGEIFYIEAYDQSGGIILQDSIMAGEPNTGDGISTCWGFNLMGCEGTVYQIKFSGFRPGGSFGMGLDNLSFCYSGIDVEINSTQPSCGGELDGVIEVVTLSGGPYTFSLDGVNFTSDGLFTNLQPDSYDIFVMDSDGCMTTYEVSLPAAGANTSGFLEDSFCFGDSVVINDVTYKFEGNYNQFLTNAAGCDSILSISLSLSSSFSLTINEEICQGDSLVINGITYAESGAFIQENTTAEGCDSNYIINLQVIDIAIGTIDETICSGDSLVVNGFVYSVSGDFEQELLTGSGCDSLLNITLMVEMPEEGLETASICEGDSIQINNIFYNNAGTYTQLLQTDVGCDSLLNITIDLLPSFQVTESYVLSSGQTIDINGTSYDEPGNYEQLLTAGNGCDSLVIITIQPPPLLECEDPCVAYVPIQEFTVTTNAVTGGNYSIKINGENLESIYSLPLEQTEILLQMLDIESELGIADNLFRTIHQENKTLEILHYLSTNEAVKTPANLSNFFIQNYELASSQDEIVRLINKVKNQNNYILDKIKNGGTSKKSILHRSLNRL